MEVNTEELKYTIIRMNGVGVSSLLLSTSAVQSRVRGARKKFRILLMMIMTSNKVRKEMQKKMDKIK